MVLHQLFFSLLLLFLPTQLGYHFWPEWTFVLGRRVDYLSPTIYLTDILLFLTVASWVTLKISNIKYQISNIQIKHQKLLVPLLLGLFILFNLFVSANKPVAIYKWLKIGEFVALGWYIVKTKPHLSLIASCLSLGLLYSSLLAITQFFLQRSVGGPFWWLGERTFTVDTPGIARLALNWDLGPASPAGRFGAWDFGLKLRPYATFPHPNVLGGYITAILPLAIWQISNLNPSTKLRMTLSEAEWVNPQISKMFYGTTIFFGVIALLLTFSRSAIVVGTLIGMWAMWKKFRAVHRKGVFFQIIPVAFLGALLLITYHLSLITFSMTEESVVVRQQLNAAAIRLWQQSPVVGIGLGNFLVKLPEVLPSRQIYFLQPVHNIYLLLLAETGVVGLVLSLWGIWSVLRMKEKGKRKKEKGNSQLSSHLLLPSYHLSLLVLLLLGLIDHYPITLQQGQLLLTLLLALLVY